MGYDLFSVVGVFANDELRRRRRCRLRWRCRRRCRCRFVCVVVVAVVAVAAAVILVVVAVVVGVVVGVVLLFRSRLRLLLSVLLGVQDVMVVRIPPNHAENNAGKNDEDPDRLASHFTFAAPAKRGSLTIGFVDVSWQ